MKKSPAILTGLVIVSPLAIIVSLGVGDINIGMLEVLKVLFSSNNDATQSQVINILRLPRTLAAFTCGALLAMAGVLMQVLLRNPLADPYILGVSGGAAVLTLLAMLMGLSGALLTGSAFIGSLLSMIIVFGLAHGSGSWTPTRLLLTGVVVAAGWGAVISFILTISPDRNLHGMLFWLMGDLAYVQSVRLPISILAIGITLGLLLSRNLNVMLHGELQASALGIDVKRLRILIYVFASILTATSVTLAGTVGFIGLVVPHLIRLTGINDHRYLLPCSVLLGGTILVLADMFARTIISPYQLPVGVLTAMIGVPFFLLLLQKSSRTL